VNRPFWHGVALGLMIAGVFWLLAGLVLWLLGIV